MRKYIKEICFLFFVLVTIHVAADESKKETSLSEAAAAGNDYILTKGQNVPLLKPITWTTSRAMGLAIFPICSAVDMAVLVGKQAHETPHLLLEKDPSQRELHLSNYQKNKEALKKTSLGLVASPLGILSPDIVTHHFVPHQTQSSQITPYGKLYSTHAHVAYPQTIADVQEIVLEAKRSGKSISTLGKTMSQGKQAISNQDWNIAIDTSNLNQIEIDPNLKIARVGAGASWGDLQREANPYGLAIRVMQASNIFSIGGSISVNCHGWDHKTGSLRNTLLAITVVDAQGQVLEVTPEDPFFDYIVGGYGGFGIIVQATLSLTDNVELIEKGIEIAPSEYLSYFNDHIRDHSDIDMHLYRLSLEPKRLFKTGIAVNYIKVADEPVSANLIDEPDRGSRMDRIKIHALRRLSWLRDYAWKIEKQAALSEKTLSRNELMRPPINPIFNHSKIDTEWLQEYFVKGEDLPEFLKYLGNILQKNNVALFNASVRFVKHDPRTKLSYAKDGDRFAVVLFFNQKLSPKEIQKTQAWVRQVIDYLIAHEGTYYLPYQHFATPEQFKACYPNWETVIAYKQSIDPEGLFDNGFYADYLNPISNESSLFRQVFNKTEGQRSGIRDFLNNVFMQLDEKKFFPLVDSILDNSQLNDDQIYAILYNNIGQAKPNKISLLHQTLQSLKSLKNELGDQTAFLVGQRKINGYVEIGYPGRMIHPLKERLDMKRPFYVLHDQERLSDYIEAGVPRPYDQFVSLNDYAPIPEDAIPTASVDLVCMYIGLHHAPEEKLGPFIESIKRILRPGGIFILMDHDAYTEELQNLVDVVHSIFNAATGVEPQVNQQEIRNFQSLQYWIDLLESHGLAHDKQDPLIREGDSTLNSLVRFNKSATDITPETIVESLSRDPNYSRPQKQTYLTAPEWQNVRASQRYAEFVEDQPAYRYPYFREIGGFWKVYGQSWKAAQKQNGFNEVALAEYNLMNLFVGTSMTLEYGAKGILAAPIALADQVVGGSRPLSEKSPTDQERVRSLKAYGNYIENTPFYQYPYFKDIKSYWGTYLKANQSAGSHIKGALVGTGMTVEYALKGLISAPLSYFYGSETMKEAETTHLLIHDPKNLIETVDPSIVVLETYPEHELKHVEIPRYMRFTEMMLKIANRSDITCLNIAGHDKIQIDVKSRDSNLPKLAGMHNMYQIPAPTDLEYTYMALEVDVDQICNVIRELAQHDIAVLFIHDY